MSENNTLPVATPYEGGKDKSTSRSMAEKLESLTGARTIIEKTEGKTVMLKTRHGMPEVVTTTEPHEIQPWRCPNTKPYLLESEGGIDLEAGTDGRHYYAHSLLCGEQEVFESPSPAAPGSTACESFAKKIKVLKIQSEIFPQDRRPATLFTGLARKFSQLLHASGKSMPLSCTWPTHHGIHVVTLPTGRIEHWLVEIGTGGIYFAKVRMDRPCEAFASIEPFLPTDAEIDADPSREEYKKTLSLHWAWSTGKRSRRALLKKLDVDVSPAYAYSPFSDRVGYAFSYSGHEAQCVGMLPNDEANCWAVGRMKVALACAVDGRKRNFSAAITLEEEHLSFVPSSSLAIWFPDSSSVLYQQLYSYDQNSVHPSINCTNVPLGVYYRNDTAQIVCVSQQEGSLEPDIDETYSCDDSYASFNSGNPRFNGTATRTTSVRHDLATINAGSEAVVTAESSTIKNETTEDSSNPGTWYLANATYAFPGYYLTYWQETGMEQRVTVEDIVTEKRCGVVFNYFDRESSYVLQHTAIATHSNTHLTTYNSHGAEFSHRVTMETYSDAVASVGTPVDPGTYPSHPEDPSEENHVNLPCDQMPFWPGHGESETTITDSDTDSLSRTIVSTMLGTLVSANFVEGGAGWVDAGKLLDTRNPVFSETLFEDVLWSSYPSASGKSYRYQGVGFNNDYQGEITGNTVRSWLGWCGDC